MEISHIDDVVKILTNFSLIKNKIKILNIADQNNKKY